MFDLAQISAATHAHGPVARVVIASHDGSSPRENGAAMLVWREGQTGTIGGGALEWQALARARARLEAFGRLAPDADAAALDGPELHRAALGPALGQCCGGAVSLVCEIWHPAKLAALSPAPLLARPVTPAAKAAPPPLAVERIRAIARAQGRPAPGGTQLIAGWLIEPLVQPCQELWLWGAGHVGRAIAATLAPLPDFTLRWIDTDRARFPQTLPEGVTEVIAAEPAALVSHAPPQAWHLIVTYSHALDLELCHRLLQRGFAFAGLIGSATKKARFGARLTALGHNQAEISRITCPIGDIGLGKHPQAIAVGVAVQLLRLHQKSETEIADDRTGRRAVAAGGVDPGMARRDRE